MDLNTYQRLAGETAIFPHAGAPEGMIYTALKLAGEAGEVSEKIGKLIRDSSWPSHPMTEAQRLGLAKELGDVLWYVAVSAQNLSLPLALVAEMNLEKLASRLARRTLSGSGDDR